MVARKGEQIICGGCGAEVRFGPATCPLCGRFVGNPPPPEGTSKRATSQTVEDYQEDLRRLREELDKLRKEIA